MAEAQEEQPTPRSQALRAHVHRINNALYVIQMGLKALPSVRGDEAQFGQVCQGIEADGVQALKEAVGDLVRVAQEMSGVEPDDT